VYVESTGVHGKVVGHRIEDDHWEAVGLGDAVVPGRADLVERVGHDCMVDSESCAAAEVVTCQGSGTQAGSYLSVGDHIQSMNCRGRQVCNPEAEYHVPYDLVSEADGFGSSPDLAGRVHHIDSVVCTAIVLTLILTLQPQVSVPGRQHQGLQPGS
jgi:hypothetical protein